MSAEWDACSPEYKERAKIRASQINALGTSYVACWNFGALTDDSEMMFLGMELNFRAMALAFEDIKEMRNELKRVGFQKGGES